jgi:hypothetical protein
MPIFRLDPIEGTLGNRSWQATYLRERCWVDAQDEAAARTAVSVRTMQFVERMPGLETPLSAWQRAELTECHEVAPPFEIGEGEVWADDEELLERGTAQGATAMMARLSRLR